MTTTIFRKNKGVSCVASDSRVTLVDVKTNLPLKWFDSSNFKKNILIDDVVYGFAGTNAMFKVFLETYDTAENSEYVLDTVVELAKKYRVQFFVLRYDGTALKLFAYSPKAVNQGVQMPEIHRISSDPVIDKGIYAIGSGKFSKEYKKHKKDLSAQVPIRRIIAANNAGLRKAGLLDLDRRLASGTLTLEESKEAFLACSKKGGDVFTGGEIAMSRQNATKQEIAEQIAILNQMDATAKAMGAVCASPVNAVLEVAQLKTMEQYAVTPHKVEMTEERRILFEKMERVLTAAI